MKVNDQKITTEIERKYIIFIPEIHELESMSEYSKSEIVQTYLKGVAGETHRVRSRTTSGKTVYTETRKIRIDHISVTEIERELTLAEYEELILTKDVCRTPIVKTRHTFVYRGQLYEIDVYPDWRSTCVMETELTSRTERAEIPPFIRIIKEVTGEKKYSNAAMAKQFPPEITLISSSYL